MIYFIACLFGLAIGSFLNVVIARYPTMLKQLWDKEAHDYLHLPHHPKEKLINLWLPASHCTHCKTRLSWWQLIPIFSYISLHGRCFFCKQSVSTRYPVIELLTAFATVVCLAKFGITYQGLFALLFMYFTIPMMMIDFDTQLLPDEMTLSLLWLDLLANVNHQFTNLSDAVIAAMIAYLSLWLIGKLFKVIRKKDGIGYGDYKLFACLGAWFGLSLLPLLLFIAAVIALFVGVILLLQRQITRNKPLAFGPYLILSGWLALFFNSYLLNYLYRITG